MNERSDKTPRDRSGRADSRARPDARSAAVAALTAVDPGGAPSGSALSAAMDRANLSDPRERGLATELVYGCLRRRDILDRHLRNQAGRRVRLRTPEALWALRMGAYQLLYLDRVPAHAAVSTAVDAIKRFGGPREAGFSNAVLRGLARREVAAVGATDEGTDRPHAPDAPNTIDAIAETYGHPPWIVAQWWAADGAARAAALGAAYDRSAPVTVRLRRDPARRERALAWLGAVGGVETDPGQWPESLRLRGGIDPIGCEPFRDGDWMPQDEASQWVTRVVPDGALLGGRVLEICGGSGTKTTDLAERVGPDGRVVVVDVDGAKLQENTALVQRFGLTERVDYRRLDATCLDLGEQFDVVIVDAPCTGLGAMRRRPEVKFRRTPADVAALAPLQLAILTSAARHVRPGGQLVYAVCTFTAAEGPDVARRWQESTASEFVPHVGDGVDEAGWLRTSPLEGDRDGFFIASWDRRPARKTETETK